MRYYFTLFKGVKNPPQISDVVRMWRKGNPPVHCWREYKGGTTMEKSIEVPE